MLTELFSMPVVAVVEYTHPEEPLEQQVKAVAVQVHLVPQVQMDL
jgi:hypothetical protein